MLFCGATCKATPKGFEPLRAEPSGFLVHLLSHSDKVSCCHRAWFAISRARDFSPPCLRQPPALKATAPRARRANHYFMRAKATQQTRCDWHGKLVLPDGEGLLPKEEIAGSSPASSICQAPASLHVHAENAAAAGVMCRSCQPASIEGRMLTQGHGWQWAVMGVEPRTSRALSEIHIVRPNSQNLPRLVFFKTDMSWFCIFCGEPRQPP